MYLFGACQKPLSPASTSTLSARGLSRNEYLRRRFESERSATTTSGQLTINDLRRAAEASNDLDDPHVMEAAWR